MLRLLASPWAVAAWGAASVLIVLAQSWYYHRVRSRFHSWQPVEATVLESWVRSYTDMDGEYVREPVVKFSYSYEGQEYVSDTPYLRSYFLGSKFVDVSDIANQFSKGDVLTARLHPQVPEVCYIGIARFDWKSILLLAGGIVVFGFGAYFIAGFIKGGHL